MNSAFVEIEEQKQVIQQLENKQFAAKAGGKIFDKLGELQNAKKKLMLMQKQRMMNKQMMMFKQKQMMMAKQRAVQQQALPSLSGGAAPLTLGLNETTTNQVERPTIHYLLNYMSELSQPAEPLFSD